MAEINNISFYRGTAIVLQFTMTPLTDITGWSITLTLRTNANDSAVVLQKNNPSFPNAAGGVFSFSLSHAETVLLSGSYAYDVQRTDVASEGVLSIGVITIIQEVLYP